MGVLGDIQYRAALVWKVLNGNATTTRKFLRQVGTGAASAAPAWDTLQAADLPSTAVTPASYGDATHVAAFTVDQQGRLTAASNVAITATGTVTHTGSLTSGTLIQGNGVADVTLNATTATVTKLTSGVPSAATAGTDYTDAAFNTISVSGQSDVVADSAADTLTLAAGTNVTITTNASTDTITIAASGGSGTVTTTGSPASGNLTKFSGATSIVNGDLSGDVTTSGTLATTIANDAVTTVKILNANVTLAKIANAAASSKLVGSGASGSGAAYSEITLGTGLTMTATTLSASGGGSTIPATFNARLTTETGVPVSTGDRTGQGTIFLTPYQGNQLALYTGAAWTYYTLASDLSLVLTSLTSGKPYDVFVNYNSGSPTIEIVVWTSDTARATALATQDGVYVQTGAATKRYVGTIYTTGTASTEDSTKKRFVWNYYNRVMRSSQCPSETADNWSYATNTLRQANANTANQFEVVVGIDENPVTAAIIANSNNSNGSGSARVAVGLDSTSTAATGFLNNRGGATATAIYQAQTASWVGYVGVGRHFIVWLEAGNGTGTQTWFGDNGGGQQCGINGTCWG